MSITELDILDREIRNCTKCASVLSAHPEDPPKVMRLVEPRPILSAPMQAPVMLIGQAPGLTEYRTGRPFSGPAGDGIRSIFSDCGLPRSEFDRTVYQTSAVKCFPGRRPNKDRWEDRPPCPAMQRHCGLYLKQQIDVVRPSLIVAMGVVATAVLDRMRNIPVRKLSEVVGVSELWQDKTVVYLAHTSGGSRFLNDPENRAKQEQAKAILKLKLSTQVNLYSA